ncbi:hypothetical protein KFL_007160040 [Klebsormidium nitens]|uniref:Uncharacterized protein n=1 Tax=Klebsormidium nitens TaxID=105231 RepID=A0A1Y1IJX9_KLENI|nr:hypothetical protein KFL_007160040 [Klebsormidium nitens]|eukprot:GAQ91033.1 hypothetical protein KFL_007160040 [Klebsormidium nitens]
MAPVHTSHDRVIALRGGPYPRILVCNDPVCRASAPGSQPCSKPDHAGEEWECPSSERRRNQYRADHWQAVDTLSLGGCAGPAGEWSDAEWAARSEQRLFSAPREKAQGSGRACSLPWVVKSSMATVYCGGGRSAIQIERRKLICQGGCCTLSYSGREDGVYAYTSESLFLYEAIVIPHLQNAQGATFQSYHMVEKQASALLAVPGASHPPPVGDSNFDRAIRAFNVSAARDLAYCCSSQLCSGLFGRAADLESTSLVSREGRSEYDDFALTGKAIVGDGTLFSNSSVVRDSCLGSIRSLSHPTPDSPIFTNHTTPRMPPAQAPPQQTVDVPYTSRTFVRIPNDNRLLVKLWANDRHIPSSANAAGNQPLTPDQFDKMYNSLPESFKGLVTRLLIDPPNCAGGLSCSICRGVVQRKWMGKYRGPLREASGELSRMGWAHDHFFHYSVLISTLLGSDHSRAQLLRVNSLKITRKALLGGTITSTELRHLERDAPLIGAILRSYPDPHSKPDELLFEQSFLPVLRDLYCTAMVSFEPSSNRCTAEGQSPLRKLVDAFECIVQKGRLERALQYRLLTEAGGDGTVVANLRLSVSRATEKVVAALESATEALAPLEIKLPSEIGTMPATPEYQRRASLVGFYPHGQLPKWMRPHFPDFEGPDGYSKSRREDIKCNGVRSDLVKLKGMAGLFLICCPDGYVIGFHYMVGGESVSDLFTLLVTLYSFEQLKGLTIIYDNR